MMRVHMTFVTTVGLPLASVTPINQSNQFVALVPRQASHRQCNTPRQKIITRKIQIWHFTFSWQRHKPQELLSSA
jgi:hypothetical protein